MFSSLPEQVRPVQCLLGDQPFYILTGDSWAPAVCSILENAQHRIEIAAYSISTRWPRLKSDKFNPYKRLITAPSRGVRCLGVLAQHKRTAATSRFNRYATEQLESAGWAVRRAPSSRLLHAKLFIVDRRIVVIGSHNIAHAASAVNIDVSIAFDSAVAAAPFVSLFYDVWSRSG